ncbi:taste receptor type 2 member 40-like [Myiozetetes cayanensis]|uniref:taste receptor type 2 member 40-like n=1 Tax=Myiozetetes cayanensis TaxID=478635 RepID=UPI00215EDB3A|nr:taste receptor type 2 member 40-like [Myiozetetes cayanensis]
MEACHSPEQFNVTSYDATAVAVITLEAFAGMWINAFIVFVICMSWVKKKILNSNEKILLVVGCSRFWFLCISWVYSFLSVIYPHSLYVHPTLQLFVSIQSFFSHSSLWFSACLCVFYCIKIANFQNSFFIYLKVKVDRMVPWLLLGSVLFALTISILAYDIAGKLHSKDRNSTCPVNFLKESIKIQEHFFHIYFIADFGYATSFMAVIFSALLLLFSLWRHKRNMQTNSMKDLSMDAHIKAMKSILSFFVMYSINFACLIFNMIYATEKESPVKFLNYVFLYAFPGIHSLVLIFSNPKLKNTLLRILPCVKCKVCMR